MRREHIGRMILDGYILATQEEKDEILEKVFEYYYDRNDMDLEIALDEIEADIIMLEEEEQYERCLILKDILERFE